MTDTGTKPCVLVVEDEAMVAMMLEDRLEYSGYRVLKAARVAGALELIGSETIDIALLDVNLAGQQSFPVAALLRERGIPFVFASGYGDEGICAEFSDVAVLQKPYDSKALTDALAAALDRR
jgi:DNA-binding response OmpR family regulator